MLDNSMDTIAAICTGMTGSGINIIRISGEKAFEIADKIFISKSGKNVDNLRNFSVNYGFISDKKGLLNGDEAKVHNVDKVDILDEVLLLKMKAPHSYTCEDVIEIDCHGGITVTGEILKTILKNGARLAEPGEFTKRAFLNGRIDLSQAEAVNDIINAKSNLALKNSVKQLKGQVKRKIIDLRDRIISKTAYIEAALDDPEHISLEGFSEKLEKEIRLVQSDIKKLIDSFSEGRFINEGINTCIIGLPNAGKSSLLNALLDEDRAIVTDIAGTTRDILKETVVLSDVVLNIIDTAGIRNTDNVIEKIGVERAKKEAENADLILYVVDVSLDLTDTDREIIKNLNNKKIILVYNKSDLLKSENYDEKNIVKDKNHVISDEFNEEIKSVVISTVSGEGIDQIKEMIREMFYNGSINSSEDLIITNARHSELLISAQKSIDNVLEGIENGMSEDFLTIDMMDAYESLGKIVGESVEDDLADRIFRDFCMGK